MDRLVKHFVKVTEHPAQTDVIFYPEEGQEDTPEGILKTIKEWRAKNGKPGFKE
ncbi:Colicin/pyocin immunity protein [Pseudomonas ficuserectae]|nr:Colicin/pyocin immunity protein [Pseudomonas ficuserectae]